MADGTPNLEPQVAVLKQIAADTRQALERIERRLDALDKRQHTDFLWLLAIFLGGYASMLGVMSRGFKWI